jgi:hypothetical protein
LGIGCNKQNGVIVIDGNSGNVDFKKTVSLSTAGISNLATTIAGKADTNVANLPNFHNKQDIERILGSYYTRVEIDSALDQKFTFFNPGTSQFNRWIKLGSITYPTASLNDCLYSVLKIYFVQNVLSNEDYYMTVLIKFAPFPLGGSTIGIGADSVSYPMKASCEYTIHSRTTTTAYPKLVLGQDVVAQNTIFSINMDMGTGDNPGGVFSLSKGMMFVNGTAPFVYSGVISQNTDGAFLRTITPVVNFSNYNPPTADTVLGLDHYIRDTSSHKYIITAWGNSTRFFRLGFLVLSPNGRRAKITLHANQGYEMASSPNAATAYQPQNYCCEIYLYSGAGLNSISLGSTNTSGLTARGCFHYGFATVTTLWAKPDNVYLCPDIDDPVNRVSIWVKNTAYWGTPMVEVSTTGDWFQNQASSETLPNTGWVTLPLRTITMV